MARQTNYSPRSSTSSPRLVETGVQTSFLPVTNSASPCPLMCRIQPRRLPPLGRWRFLWRSGIRRSEADISVKTWSYLRHLLLRLLGRRLRLCRLCRSPRSLGRCRLTGRTYSTAWTAPFGRRLDWQRLTSGLLGRLAHPRLGGGWCSGLQKCRKHIVMG